jgi:uncharacterized RDD family membrane protein YckC
MAACTNHPEVTQGVAYCVRCRRPFCPNCVVRLRGLAYCGSCKTEQVRDIQSGTVAGQLELASTGRRFSAMWVDALLFRLLSTFGAPMARFVVGAAGGTVTETGGAVLALLALFFSLALWAVYEGLMLQARGQTLGKMALGLKVVTIEGGDISAGQAWTRAAIRQLLGSLLLVDYIPAFFTKDKTCLHDIIAKTRVVRTRK